MGSTIFVTVRCNAFALLCNLSKPPPSSLFSLFETVVVDFCIALMLTSTCAQSQPQLPSEQAAFVPLKDCDTEQKWREADCSQGC